MMRCARPWAPALGTLGLVLLLAGCGTSRQASAAVEVNPNHLRAQSNLGVASARLGRHDEAFAADTRVLTMNPTDANAHANVGWLLLKVGRQTEGLRELQVAVNLEPSLDQERRFLDVQFGRDARQAPTPFSVR
jgi:Flp pilus assembly protein TadD